MILKCISKLPNFTISKSYTVINEIHSPGSSWAQYLIRNDIGVDQWAYSSYFIPIDSWRQEQLKRIGI